MNKEVSNQTFVIMYVGNLEEYQGIDLLLESFVLVSQKADYAELVIIGGQPRHIQKYEQKSRQLGVERKVRFLGPKPVRRLAEWLAEADLLVSPRIKGSNTPMKIYSYLHSGKAIVATNLATHTQILDSRVAMLTEPCREEFAKAILYLMENDTLRTRLGDAGKELVDEKYSYPVFRERLHSLFDWLETEVA